jgi:hypothetical protein
VHQLERLKAGTQSIFVAATQGVLIDLGQLRCQWIQQASEVAGLPVVNAQQTYQTIGLIDGLQSPSGEEITKVCPKSIATRDELLSNILQELEGKTPIGARSKDTTKQRCVGWPMFQNGIGYVWHRLLAHRIVK